MLSTNPAMKIIAKNTYPDNREVVFDEAAHTYSIYGENYTSVSKVVAYFKPPFDPTGEILLASAKKKNRNPADLKAEWQAKAKRATDRGTQIHEMIEHHINLHLHRGVRAAKGSWLEQVIDCIKPFRSGFFKKAMCEQVIATTPEFAVCGTADLLLHGWDENEDDLMVIYDYKTNEVFKTEPFTAGEKLLGSAGHFGLLNCDQDIYTLQMSIYAYCLRAAGCKVFENAIIIHIDHENLVKRIPLKLLSQEQVHEVLSEYKFVTRRRAIEQPAVIARQFDFGLPAGFGYTKTDFERLAVILNEHTVEGGVTDPLDAYVKVSGLIETMELYREKIKSEAIAQAEKYPVAERKRNGVTVSVRDAGRWAYPAVESVDSLKNEVKRLEKLMKSAGENKLPEIPDPQTGEMLPAAVKSSTTTLALTFPKA